MITAVIFCSFLLMVICTSLILLVTKKKTLKFKQEIRTGLIGSLWFAYVSWACIYMAQYRPKYVTNEKEEL